MKKNIYKYLRIAVSFVLLIYLFYYLVDFKSLTGIIKGSNLKFLSVSVAFFMMSVFAAAFRWQYVVSLKNRKLTFKTSLREYFIGMFFNNFLPGSVGGDVARVIGAAEEIGSKEISVSSVIVERLIGLISLVAIGLTGLIFLNIDSGSDYTGISILILVTLSVILFALIIRPVNDAVCELIQTYIPEKISSNLILYMKDFSGYSKSPFKLLVVFLISFAFKIFDGFFLYFIFKSLAINLTYPHAIAMFAIINVIKMIPISLNGIGLSALSWVIILKSFNIDENLSASVDFLTITISLVISGIGGLLYFAKNTRNKKTA
ncbi:MAG: lysylphosphatidylglycerol synthase transmembrane domain-containing protein [Candidatus Delongbacteria bacterium]